MSEAQRPLNTIGVACSLHDPALAIVNARGEVTFAESTERHLQDKRAFGAAADPFFRIPELLAQHCDPDADLVVARTWSAAFQSRQPASLRRAVRRVEPARSRARQWPWLRRRSSATSMPRRSIGRWASSAAQARYIEQCVRRYPTSGAAIEYHCRSTFGDRHRKIAFVDCEHHATHAWYACLSSPFTGGLCAVIDGEGEGRSSSFYRYNNGRVTELPIAPGRHQMSLGALYSFLTEICGFDSWRGEEWKLMGLASYGAPREDYEQMLRGLIAVDGVHTIMPRRSQARVAGGLRETAGDQAAGDQPALAYADLARTMQKVSRTS